MNPEEHPEQRWKGEVGVATGEDLAQVLKLQQDNLGRNLPEVERQDQGYVSVETPPDMLEEINESDGVTVAKDGDRVVGYAMPLPVDQGRKIPLLDPFIERFSKLSFEGTPITETPHIIIGQVCVDKDYRGRGIIEQLYADFSRRMAEKYDVGITEVGATNPRSYHVHVEKMGMKVLEQYEADGKAWYILAVDFRPFRRAEEEVVDDKK